MAALVEDDAVGSFSSFVEQDPRSRRVPGRCAKGLGPRQAGGSHASRPQPAFRGDAAQSHTRRHGGRPCRHGDLRVCRRRDAGRQFRRTLRHDLVAPPLSAGPDRRAGHRQPTRAAVRGFCLDFCEDLGLPLLCCRRAPRPLSGEVLPDFAAIDNPLDITAMGMSKPSLFGDTCAAMLARRQRRRNCCWPRWAGRPSRSWPSGIHSSR